MSNYLTDYRPEVWEGVKGQDQVVKSIQEALEDDPPKAYLLTGPSGTGKTTIARIIAEEMNVDPTELVEIDAASNSGVEQMRKIAAIQQFTSMRGGARMVIIDECHTLSKNAWQALLKPIEEAPDKFYWVFCTTEAAKVPKTIKTRCHSYELAAVSKDDLFEIVHEVAENEDLDIDDDILDVVVEYADGSPRQALAYLSMCRRTESKKEARGLLKGVSENIEVIELCRLLVFNTPKMNECTSLINKFKGDVKAESVRMIMLAYLTKVILNPKGKAPNYNKLLAVMEEFSQPFNDSEGMAPVVLACGRLIIGD